MGPSTRGGRVGPGTSRERVQRVVVAVLGRVVCAADLDTLTRCAPSLAAFKNSFSSNARCFSASFMALAASFASNDCRLSSSFAAFAASFASAFSAFSASFSAFKASFSARRISAADQMMEPRAWGAGALCAMMTALPLLGEGEDAAEEGECPAPAGSVLMRGDGVRVCVR